jgi:hypothetical protein
MNENNLDQPQGSRPDLLDYDPWCLIDVGPGRLVVEYRPHSDCGRDPCPHVYRIDFLTNKYTDIPRRLDLCLNQRGYIHGDNRKPCWHIEELQAVIDDGEAGLGQVINVLWEEAA